MLNGIKCAKCKEVVSKATSIALRPRDTVHKMVCYPCHDRLTEYRRKRKEKLSKQK